MPHRRVGAECRRVRRFGNRQADTNFQGRSRTPVTTKYSLGAFFNSLGTPYNTVPIFGNIRRPSPGTTRVVDKKDVEGKEKHVGTFGVAI